MNLHPNDWVELPDKKRTGIVKTANDKLQLAVVHLHFTKMDKTVHYNHLIKIEPQG